jgi:hypothetical protein
MVGTNQFITALVELSVRATAAADSMLAGTGITHPGNGSIMPVLDPGTDLADVRREHLSSDPSLVETSYALVLRYTPITLRIGGLKLDHVNQFLHASASEVRSELYIVLESRHEPPQRLERMTGFEPVTSSINMEPWQGRALPLS